MQPRAVGTKAARDARVDLGIGLDAPVADILDLIDREADVPVTVIDLPEGIAGMLRRKREGSFIFINGREPVVRQRFTLAHEFGHHRLGHRSVVDRFEDIFGPAKDPQEVEANYFAGEFLAPRQAIENWLERHAADPSSLEAVVRLGRYFGVSAQVARIRVENAQRITRAAARKLDDRIKERDHLSLHAELDLDPYRDQLAEIHRSKLPRLPARTRRGVRAAFRAGLVDIEEAAELLRRTVPEVRGELERDPRAGEALDE